MMPFVPTVAMHPDLRLPQSAQPTTFRGIDIIMKGWYRHDTPDHLIPDFDLLYY